MDSPCAATSGASVLAGGTDIKRMNSSTVYDSNKCFGAFIKMGLGQECREGPFASGKGTEGGRGRAPCRGLELTAGTTA